MFLELRNTSIGYQTPLIKGIDTSLKLGEICLLIGNNGVGKTTLIKSILHQTPLLSGDILLKSKSITHLSSQEIAEQIAVVFSTSSIPLHYTTKDLVSLGKYIHYPYYFELNRNDKNEVEDIIEQLHLSEYKDFPLSKLSDGNLQKAFIGRALAQNSSMIILDEPTTHLDEDNKIMILNLLRNLAKNHQKLILFSSHDWRLAKAFSDKIWYVKNQKLASGFSEEMILQHKELSSNLDFITQSSIKLPTIIAPPMEKELMESFLMKNTKKEISNWTFTFTKDLWMIDNTQEICHPKDWQSIAQLIS